jgi:MFS family permease
MPKDYRTGRVVGLATTAALGGFLFGYDSAVINGAASAIKSTFGLGSFALGFVVSIALVGSAIGAWFAGYFADRYGRQPVMLLAALLFMGGWNGPIPVATLLGLSEGTGDTAHYVVRLVGLANLIGKATLGVLMMMWIRWTLPRLRIDQVMSTCLKYCTPLAAAMFLGAMLWQIALPGGLVPMLHRPAAEIREGWLPGPGGEVRARDAVGTGGAVSAGDAVAAKVAQVDS